MQFKKHTMKNGNTAVLIPMTLAEKRFAEQAGAAIHQNHDPFVDKDAMRVRSDDRNFEHKLGCVAESAVEKWSGGLLPMSTKKIRRGDGGTDGVLNGFTVDVKARSELSHDLHFVRHDQVKADFYIFATAPVAEQRVYLWGYAPASLLLAQPPAPALNEGLHRHQKYMNLYLKKPQMLPLEELAVILGIPLE